ncbi:unnamed protein product [Coregonus sp. 'balchen']|nr:unnamed protein product [Coregonus sp. 'balchen']
MLVKYFSRQLSCKVRAALQEDSTELQDFPRLGHWFRIVNLRKEVTEMSDEEVCEAMEKFGANDEECARLNASLSCLRRAHKSGRNPTHSEGGKVDSGDKSASRLITSLQPHPQPPAPHSSLISSLSLHSQPPGSSPASSLFPSLQTQPFL